MEIDKLNNSNFNKSKNWNLNNNNNNNIITNVPKLLINYQNDNNNIEHINNYLTTKTDCKSSTRLLPYTKTNNNSTSTIMKNDKLYEFNINNNNNKYNNNNLHVIATSLTELQVGKSRDTRRACSEPGSISSGTVRTTPRTRVVIKPPRSTTASRITSIDKINSIDNNNNINYDKSIVVNNDGKIVKPINIINSGNNSNNNLQMTSVGSTVVSPVTSLKSVPSFKTSTSIDNNNCDNESDYVVDPVQGTAYHKGQFLGKGGFARVYLMTDITNGNKYACKIIPKNRMQKIHIQKIAREIMIHKDLNHINVVQMHHYFENSLNVYMLLEACPRKSLMHVLKYRGKITEPEARYYMKQMTTGIAYIHSQKIVHRDLKPGNMFLSDGMIVKIGDFGLATCPDGQKKKVTICGTPNYIAPEVLFKQAYSYEADIWALGCILYALLVGQPPFDTATLKETYSRICNNRYKEIDNTIITNNGQNLIRWLLQPVPELRPSLKQVNQHPYLNIEYVPDKLSHSCCYRQPELLGPIENKIINNQQNQKLAPTASMPSVSSSLSSTSSCSTSTSKPVIQKQLPVTFKNNTDNKNIIGNNLQIMKNSQIIIKKKSNVGNWLGKKFPKFIKLKQRIGNLLCSDKKKTTENIMMYHALENCLMEIRYMKCENNPKPIDGLVPLFVTKWIDYSNKYGLCFQLSDCSVGVLFNDSTKMSYTRDRRVEYTTSDDEVTKFSRERDVPVFMNEKLELLRHFTEYMDDHLTNGGEIGDNVVTKTSKKPENVPRMRRWLRTDKAIVMELTVPLLQVNFFADHTKIVVSGGTRPRDYLVTYIDASRHATSYWLNDIRESGCTIELYERLNYVCKASREFAHLENTNNPIGCLDLPINNGTILKA
ncbi:serine/threonine-protein kinase PLK1-like isoform X2 [Aphidius gifuensis]|uniref:serine/threonine-protein kinase PLK1-like isoform X2 n=1 Tax=Aphidius gifuensis TaxID=684658 RepID=UPI001CDCB48D|nr:serine/threonine-protein kinase PLK1-like isoform X2 [Aphidius gifuensis]